MPRYFWSYMATAWIGGSANSLLSHFFSDPQRGWFGAAVTLTIALAVAMRAEWPPFGNT